MFSFSRRLALLAIPSLAALLLAAACGDEDSGGAGSTTGSGVKVVATTTQIGALARAVAGDEVELTVLLAPGAGAHEYEPSPDAIRKINAAALILKHGIGLDDWLDKSIEGAGGKNVVSVTEGISVEKAAGDEAGEDDPHVWHDPTLAQAMLANVVKALSAADPEHAALFQQNGDAYKARLEEVDAEIRALIDTIPPANRKLVTNHDAFGYFIRRYGLEYVGAIIPSTSESAEPSAKSIADLEDTIRKTGVKAIFAEEELDPKVAKEIASDTGVKIVTDLYADSLGKPGSGAETIDGMLLSNAKKIAEALR